MVRSFRFKACKGRVLWMILRRVGAHGTAIVETLGETPVLGDDPL